MHADRPGPRALGLYSRWIVANGWSEGLGLGTSFVIGMSAAPALAKHSTAEEAVTTAVLAVALGTALEGVLVGAAQAAVLTRHLPTLRARQWIGATAVGAAVAWTLGMIPSTVMALLAAAPGAGQDGVTEPSDVVKYPLAIALGLCTGPILGAAQWHTLRRHVRGATRWLWANALAWAVGMPLIFLGMDVVPWTGSPAAKTAAIYLTCVVTGLAVGAIHGQTLRRLLLANAATAQPSAPIGGQSDR